MHYLEWPPYLFNLIKRDEGAANAAVKAHNSILDDGRKRQPIKEVIDLAEDGVVLDRVLSKPITAFLGKAERVVNALVFVVAAQQMDLVGEADLERHKQANSLKRVITAVDIVAEEKIIVRLDVAALVRLAP